MSVEILLDSSTKEVRKIIAEKVFAKLSKTAITIIFDEECSECPTESKVKDCFIPFFTDPDRIRLGLKLLF